MFKQLQKLGKAFMLPIAILPAAGLLLGIGGAFSNPNTITAYPFLNVFFLQMIFKVMTAAGEVVFANLAMVMCIGLAVGLAKNDKGVAALATAVAFLVMNATIGSLIKIFEPGGAQIDTGVVGSIVIGCLVVYLHERFRAIQLPAFLGFFGGSRFIPIAASFVAILVGAVFFIIWPPFQELLVRSGNQIADMGVIGTFFYGMLMRLSGAVGLHHMIYPMFWYTELGGVETVAGQQIVGAQKIFFAQLADPSFTGMYTYGTRFFAGRFDTMMFGLPAAALAMYHTVPKARRKLVGGLYFSAALTSFLTGITEPLEFMFLFVAPWLYVLHAFLDGLSFALADFFAIRIGNTFSGGAIDFTLFGVLQGNERTHWLYVIMIGVFWAFLYYSLWRFLILRFNVPVPGRGEEDDGKVRVESKGTIAESAVRVLAALGGPSNIEECDACITRLRVSVKDIAKVDKDALIAEGAAAVFDVKGGVQAVFGAKADLIKTKINELIGE